MRSFFIDVCNDEEMYRGMRSMNRNLYKSLEWMIEEGTSWVYVREIIRLIPAGRDVPDGIGSSDCGEGILQGLSELPGPR